MKKIITILLALLLVISFVSAKATDTGNTKAVPTLMNEDGNNKEIQEMNKTKIQQQDMVQAHNGTGIGNQTQQRVKEMIGLENALSRVTNENAREQLQANLEKFQEKIQNRMNIVGNASIEEVDKLTGAVKLKAKEQVKYFGFIKGTATKRFNVNAEGKIEENAPWYRFLYREEKQTEMIVGNDKDEHGCIRSAGYSWNETKQKCVRPWEEEINDEE